MNILLIDDEALKGWKEVLELALFQGEPIEYCITLEDAEQKLSSKKYDIIFLDLRFGESEHEEKKFENFSGFKVLNKVIRKDFEALNFSTPVIVLTASNKIWHINDMLDNGADDFYIKEHPETSNDLEFSKRNYIRLKENITTLIALGRKRSLIWYSMMEVLQLMKERKDLKSNISRRITEKLKIGYATLFRKTSQVEKTVLLFNNEILAFIIFWSMMEEVSKHFFLDKWDKVHEGKMEDNWWELRNKAIFVCKDPDGEGKLIVWLKVDPAFKFKKGERTVRPGDPDIFLFSGRISLSLQIYAVMLLQKGWDPKTAYSRFDYLNSYRNRIDFIHSSVSSIFNKNLTDFQDDNDAYDKCVEMLTFTRDMIK